MIVEIQEVRQLSLIKSYRFRGYLYDVAIAP